MRRLHAADIIATVLVLAVIAAALVPAVARMQRSPAEATCQANLKFWGKALALYCEDSDGRFPTNRVKTPGVPGPVTHLVGLSSYTKDSGGNYIRFQYGFNWVEALFPYMAQAMSASGRNWHPYGPASVPIPCGKCPHAGTAVYPHVNANPRMSYALNFNLAEYWAALVRDPQKVMMIREMDRMVPSVLRPANNSIGSSTSPPRSPFLTAYEPFIRTTSPNQHSDGSYILMADGHVAYFAREFMPEDKDVSAARCWDPTTMRWYNYYFAKPQDDSQRRLNRSIAITP